MNVDFSQLDVIINLCADYTRRFLVSSDRSKINIWDTMIKVADRPAVIHTIGTPFPETGIGTVAMSMDAKYLVAASGGPKCHLKLWLWSKGETNPDGQLSLPAR